MILLEEHEKLKANIPCGSEGDRVLDYGDPENEHINVRKNVGMIDLSFIGKFKFTGKDNATYLHNRLSNSIDTLKPGQGCYATLLDYKGRMISDLWVHRLEDFILVTTPPLTRIELFYNFNKFIFSEDVQLEDITEKWGTISIQGPKSTELINKIFNPSIESMNIRDTVKRDFENKEGYIIRTEWTGEMGYHLIFPNEKIVALWKKLWEQGKELNLKPFGMTAFESLRLEAGIPIFGLDMDKDTIPLEANLQENAISFTKGCYPGQEIIARIHNLSHPWKILVGLEIMYVHPLTGGGILYYDGEKIGKVTSSAYSPTLDKVIGLGYIPWELKDTNRTLELLYGDQMLNAVIKPLPFYSPI